MFDRHGNLIRGEAAAFAATTAKGAKLARGPASIAVVALKEVTLAGNFIYARFFGLDGAPLAPEIRIDQHTLAGYPNGFGPTISWQRDRFASIYCGADYVSHSLYLREYGAGGQPLGDE
jgi:hypothetical protein